MSAPILPILSPSSGSETSLLSPSSDSSSDSSSPIVAPRRERSISSPSSEQSSLPDVTKKTTTPLPLPHHSLPPNRLQSSVSASSAVFFANMDNEASIQGALFTAYSDDETRNFRKRFVKLQGSSLVSYLPKPDGTPQFDRVVELNEYCSVHDVQEKLRREFCWMIHVPPVGRKYYFQGKSIQQSRSWYTALNQQIRTLRANKGSNNSSIMRASLPESVRDSIPSSTLPRLSVSMPSLPSIIPSSTLPPTPENPQGAPIPPQRGSVGALTSRELKGLELKWSRLMTQHPGDERTIIFDNLTMILGMPHHPLGNMLFDFIDGMQASLVIYLQEKTVDETVITTIVNKITTFRRQLITSVMSYYDFLSLEFEKDCASAIDDVLFGGIYPDLFALLRKETKVEDLAYMNKLGEAQEVTMKQLGVKPVLWLNERGGTTNSGSYARAIWTLKKLSGLTSPQQKLQCLIDTGRAIRQCTDDYWHKRLKEKGDGSRVVLGGDDLLPLFTWTITRAQIPFLPSESRFIDYFMSNIESIGEEGYYFATFQTAIAIITGLSEELLQDDEEATVHRPTKLISSAPPSSSSLPTTLTSPPPSCSSLPSSTTPSPSSAPFFSAAVPLDPTPASPLIPPRHHLPPSPTSIEAEPLPSAVFDLISSMSITSPTPSLIERVKEEENKSTATATTPEVDEFLLLPKGETE